MNKIKFIILHILILLSFPVIGQVTMLPDSMVLRTLENNSTNKQVSVYDDNKRETLRTYYVKDSRSNDWINYMEFGYEYDDYGNQLSQTVFMRDTVSDEWLGLSKQISVFDQYGNEIIKDYYSWNADDQLWVKNVRHEVGFDSRNDKIAETYFIPHENKWLALQECFIKNKYDNQGNLIEVVKYPEPTGDNEPSLVSPVDKYEYKYDANGNLIESTYFTWIDSDNGWQGNYEYEYEYDHNGNRVLEIYSYNAGNNIWQHHYRYGHSYDDNNLMTAMYYYSWDADIQDWVGFYDYRYKYDEEGNPTYIELYRWDNGKWLYNELATYYYSGRYLIADDSTTNTDNNFLFSVYPNPTSTYLTITGVEGANMFITDANGRIIYTRKNIKENEIVQTASWVSGSYFVTIHDGVNRITRKIIKTN